MKYINSNKLEELNIDKKSTYLVIDFDRTITSFESVDSWDAIAKPEVSGNEIKLEMTKLYEKYRPIEINYDISREEKEKAMETWYTECMNIYYKHKLTEHKLKLSVKSSNLIFREGAKEFLEKLNKYNIPVIILSAGIGNTIEQFLKENDCYFDNLFIISNFITFDGIGNIEKFDNSKIIHSLNKTTETHLTKEFESKIEGRKNKILVGDLIEDENMVSYKEWNTTLKIGFLNTKEKESMINLEKYKKHFDIIYTDDDADFKDIVNILKI